MQCTIARAASRLKRSAPSNMTTLIIGGGLMGLTTAQVLAEQGESVCVLEAGEGVALEASFANGGMLTPSMPEPWNSPGIYKHLAASIFDPRSSMKLRLRAVPSLFGWGIRFLQHSTRRHYEKACIDNFSLSSFSLSRTQEITERLNLDYCRATGGTLGVFRNHADFAEKEWVCKFLEGKGMTYSVLTPDEMIAIVPALGDIRGQLYNGILYSDDECGDAHLFCRELERELLRVGGEIEFGIAASALRVERGRVIGVDTVSGFRPADRVVVAAGTASPALLSTADISLPVKPVKGYSVTIDVSGIDDLPTMPVLDDSMHSGITPLGNRLRMVGTAEFTGFDTSISSIRAGNLYDMFESILPGIAAQVDRSQAVPWAGLRPMSYDGKPFIGPCDIDGLFINCGHGHLGWTMAMGSAHVLAQQMSGSPVSIDDRPFSLNGTARRTALN
jgi:D-amino-acid dehydrogenase